MQSYVQRSRRRESRWMCNGSYAPEKAINWKALGQEALVGTILGMALLVGLFNVLL